MIAGRVLLQFVLALVFFGGLLVEAGNTTCSSTNTDWYTNVVGETPCTTYQRLRQICNADFQVGIMTSNTPPDHCDDQVSECCCNSVAFALSMLCLACQDNASNGFDAGVGAYQQYIIRSDNSRTCGTPTNKSLPFDIQAAVCNQNLKIEDALYELFWGTGEWFYVFTRDTITKDNLANNNNTFTHCNSPTISDAPTSTDGASVFRLTSSIVSSSPTNSGSAQEQTSSGTSTHLAPGAVAGIILAVLVLIALAAFAGFLFWRQRYRKRYYLGSQPAMLQRTNNIVQQTPLSGAQSESSWGNFNGMSMITSPNPPTTTASSERHLDAGPLGRHTSGRLPPAYGSFNDDVNNNRSLPPLPSESDGYEGGSSSDERSEPEEITNRSPLVPTRNEKGRR